MNVSFTLIVFAVSLIASIVVLPAVRRAALHLGAVDLPDDRRPHCMSTPRMGGLAVYLGTLVGLLVGAAILPQLSPADERALSVMMLAAAAVIILGLLDDVRSLNAWTKLLSEVVLALFLYEAGLRVETLALPGIGSWTLGTTASLLATVLWMTAVTNAFNLIDGVNGLAGGVAGVTAAALIALGLLCDAPCVVLLAAALSGGIVGFLRHNLRPGGIFLGDSGSLFLGFVLGAATLHLGQRASGPFFPGVALLLMGLPLVEIGTTVLRRTLASSTLRSHGLAGLLRFIRHELVHPDLGHLHHCLLRRGLRTGATAVVLSAAAASYCAASVGFLAFPDGWWPASLVAAAVTGICFAIAHPLARVTAPAADPSERPPLTLILGGQLLSGRPEDAESAIEAETEPEEKIAA